MNRGNIGELSVAYIRKLPRWYVAVNFEVDEVFDDIRVSVSLWPEGIPEWTLGSRRFFWHDYGGDQAVAVERGVEGLRSQGGKGPSDGAV